MKRLGVALAALFASSLAYAADLAPIEPEEAPAKPGCFSSLWAYLNSTPQDCPLSAYGFTVFGVIDAGYGFESAGVPFNRSLLTGVEEIIEKNGNRSLWLLTPNGLSQSTVGIKMDQPIAPGWSVIGDWDFGFDPYTLALATVLDLSRKTISFRSRTKMRMATRRAPGSGIMANYLPACEATLTAHWSPGG